MLKRAFLIKTRLNLGFSGLLVLILFSQAATGQSVDRREIRLQRLAESRLENASELFTPWRHLGRINVDSINVQRHNQLIQIYLSRPVIHLPIRYPWLKHQENALLKTLGRRFRDYRIDFYTGEKSLYEFIPNYFREDFLPADSSRIRIWPHIVPLITRESQPVFTGGLTGNHIALWHSHGYYYNAANDRWQWQRARLFGTVEDIFPMDYIIHYIAPMLENAGANVFIPRERDFQLHEVIVDQGYSSGNSELIVTHGESEWEVTYGGFANKDTLFDNENPFVMGSHLFTASNSGGNLLYVPDIPECGNYAVYVSWAKNPQNLSDATYEVNYAGGSNTFLVNQTMGHGTWIYLGNFYFNEGVNPSSGSVKLLSKSSSEGVITADAVRFGGGKGNVARRASDKSLPNRLSATDRGTTPNDGTEGVDTKLQHAWKISNRPRFMEGARYFLQYAGMPDTLIYTPNQGRNDYNDDFMSRGEWVNYLMGTPLGPEKYRDMHGLGIPVDLSLAFHTDAGITRGDSVIGTLAIYSAQRDEGRFPDGISRLASRDLTDIVQDQIVSDISALFKPDWTRRAIWDRQYSEAWRPNTPAMLLELLSHQNLADMRLGLDPRFQFAVSRAIYKGILRFVSHQEGRTAIVQPLPPSHFAIHTKENKKVLLTWEKVEDSLEPSATPDYYKVYMRRENEGFNEGVTVRENSLLLDLPDYNTLYSFKVTALNSGGKSFPSEILSVAIVPESPHVVLIVNGYERISGPAMFDTGEIAGIQWWDDLPIPYKFSYSYTGLQYDFDRNSPWLDDDSPGWGASFADWEGKIYHGNSFDYPYIHGQAIRNAGYSFTSVSRKAFEQKDFDLKPFQTLNIIMGKQKGIPALSQNDSIEFRVFTPAMMEKIKEFTNNNGNIILSGAYVGTDMVLHEDEGAIKFAENILGYAWRTNIADNMGLLEITDFARDVFPSNLQFNTRLHPDYYKTEAPDAIIPAGKNSTVIYRYASNKSGAAILYNGNYKVFTMGFPFETITDKDLRNQLMKNILQFFKTR
ncbi:MAG: hypothetical protein EA393_13725 [Bacteroidetes bacterium]|nr:MAG: hypothetical protein EA393_13725 [Bacteroidota bacterium]